MGFEFETVLLDVDGTLIGSNAAHAEAWTQALREHGVTVEIGQIRPLIGMGADKLLPTANVSEDSALGQAIGRRKKAIFETFLPGLQPTRGARPTSKRPGGRALARLRCGAEVTGPTGICAMPWQSSTIPQYCSQGGVETRDDWPLLQSLRMLRFDRRLDRRDLAPGCRAS